MKKSKQTTPTVIDRNEFLDLFEELRNSNRRELEDTLKQSKVRWFEPLPELIPENPGDWMKLDKWADENAGSFWYWKRELEILKLEINTGNPRGEPQK